MKSKIVTAVLVALALTATSAMSITEDEADVFYQSQQWEHAAKAYAELSAADVGNAIFAYRLGQSQFQLGQHQQAISALQAALSSGDTSVPGGGWLLLARAQAASGDEEAALGTLQSIADSGAKPYLAVTNASEFAKISHSAEYLAIIETMKPCMTEAHRAFDFWLGEWDVTMPTRPGWGAESSITLGNGGCSVHEHYRAQGGFAGKSINFFDPQKSAWHQTWIDNQGAPLYLEGNPQNGAMVLSNETNRVTWSVLEDGRVRQHWESTSDGGETWTTAFDGYYQRK
ncbi:MAG: hypothetical protein DHS20C11_11350 [Lysobacteraceae bacterium]|nr:MAG: hypothetical protein DHS20C11_11350 [Xanthomonadaceae bacterium]